MKTPPTPTVQWDDLRYFVAVAQAGSLSGAARALGVEHSTVSRRVAQLEAALALQLFRRLPRGWALTEEGERLLPEAQRLESGLHSLARHAMAGAGLHGSVRLSAPPVLLNHFVLPHLTPWRQQHPRIVLDFRAEMRRAHLSGGESDLALRIAMPDEPGLVARPVARIGYGLYRSRLASPGLPAGLIAFDASLRGSPLDTWLARQLPGSPVALRTNDLETMIHAARAGWGVALLPHFVARSCAELVPIEDAPRGPERALHLMMHPDLRRTARVRAVADALVQLFERHATQLI